jgi:hypothetical protein
MSEKNDKWDDGSSFCGILGIPSLKGYNLDEIGSKFESGSSCICIIVDDFRKAVNLSIVSLVSNGNAGEKGSLMFSLDFLNQCKA